MSHHTEWKLLFIIQELLEGVTDSGIRCGLGTNQAELTHLHVQACNVHPVSWKLETDTGIG